jgi:hypothetical protein
MEKPAVQQRRRWRPTSAGAGAESATQSGSRASDRERKNRIEEGEVVDHIQAVQSPITSAVERAGGGQERAAARPGYGELGVRVCEEEREKGEGWTRGVGRAWVLTRPRAGRPSQLGLVWLDQLGSAQMAI